MKLFRSFNTLREEIVHCRLCPRLVDFRENVPPRPAFQDQDYWGKPVPGYGDINGSLLITGLAPAAHGGNRTGRIFTGDLSARFLINVLYQAGIANQPTSESLDDGLLLNDCYITASVKCVPPGDKPTRQEFLNCSRYYHNELFLLKNVTKVLVLGKLAFDAFLFYAKTQGFSTKNVRFDFGARYQIGTLPVLYCSYHPSPRNTNTGRLTEKMLLDLLNEIKSENNRG